MPYHQGLLYPNSGGGLLGYAPIPRVRRPNKGFLDAYGGDLNQIGKALLEIILRPMESAGKQIAGDAPVDPDRITDAALASMGLGYGVTGLVGGVPKGALSAGGVYRSRLEPAIERLAQEKMTGAQARGALNKTPGGIGADELDYTGVGALLDDPSVTRTGLLGQAQANAIDIKDVVKGGVPDIAAREAAYEKFAKLGNTLQSDALEAGMSQLDALNTVRRVRDGTMMIRDLPEAVKPAAFRYYNAWEEYNAMQHGVAKGTKFHEGSMGSQETVLPGGEDYKEMLLTLPTTKRAHTAAEKDEFIRLGLTGKLTKKQEARYDELNRIEMAPRTDYTGGHYDEPNVLAHARYNTRQIDGDKTLFIEEIQSDWHQKGRKVGYIDTAAVKEFEEYSAEMAAKYGLNPTENLAMYGRIKNIPAEEIARYAELQNKVYRGTGSKGVPDAPFKKNWHDLTLRRMIREAVDTGHDRIAWTPGEVQAARYDLSKHLDNINYTKQADGTYAIVAYKNHAEVLKKTVDESGLSELVGKDVAKKMVDNEGAKTIGYPDGTFQRKLSNIDLEIGGEGMKGFYDKMMVKSANKFAKKYGQKVEVKKVGVGGRDRMGHEVLGPDGQPFDAFNTREAAEQAARDMTEAGHGYGGTYTVGEKPPQDVWSLKLTPEMKKDIQGGVLMSGGNPILGGLLATSNEGL